MSWWGWLVLFVASVILALIADTIVGNRRPQTTEPIVTSYNRDGWDGQRCLVVWPGYCCDGQAVALSLAPLIGQGILVASVKLPQQWHKSPAKLFEAVRSQLPAKAQVWVFYGLSMGGMLATQFLAMHPEYTKANTGVVMDSSPSSGKTVKMANLVLRLAGLLRGGPLLERLYRVIPWLDRRLRSWTEPSQEANPELVQRQIEALMRPDIRDATGSLAFMAGYEHPSDSDTRARLRQLVVTFVCSTWSNKPGDRLIRIGRAIHSWQSVYAQLRVADDPERETHEHACVVEKPGFVARQVTNMFRQISTRPY